MRCRSAGPVAGIIRNPMTEPDRLPLRVLVKGASTVVFTSWMGGPRSDFAWPRVIEAELFAAGYPADVRCTAIPAEPTRHAFRDWQEEVLAWSPDVIILTYGHFECVHLFLPRFLERYANSNTVRPGPVRSRYREHVVRPAWKSLAKLQSVVDGRLPPNLLSFKPRRVSVYLERLIERFRTVGSPLILIPDIPQPGKPYQKWFPGMGPRIHVMNDTLRTLVEKVDQVDVRMFSIVDVFEPLVDDPDDACPDGGHFTPPLHRAVGEAMAAVIVEWASHQTHLDLDGYRAWSAELERGRLSPAAD